jgi:alkylation response protein AidB-like acyl-CoA dehydrogenase
MAIQVETMRQLARSVAKRCDMGLPYSMEASMSKTFATDTAMRVCADAVSLMGSYGYSHDSVVEKLMRDIKIFQIFEGTNQVQRIVISRQLLN